MKNKLAYFLLAVAAIIGSVIIPSDDAHADLYGDGESLAKQFIFASVVYECFRSADERDLPISLKEGDEIDTLLGSKVDYKVTDSWLGQMSCQSALNMLQILDLGHFIDSHFLSSQLLLGAYVGGVRLPDAPSAIASNIKRLFFDGETPETYFNEMYDAELSYTLEGRYLFNGDGRNSNGCRGVSVSADDESLSALNNEAKYYWNSSLEYVKDMHVYESSTSNKKKVFRTKFGVLDNGKPTQQGSLGEVTIVPGGSKIQCSSLIKTFNGHNFDGSYKSAYEAVNRYVGKTTAATIIASAGGSSSDNPTNPGDPQNPTNPEPANPTNPDDGDTGEEVYDCYTNAGSLGWIMCPIINGLKDTILRAYADWIIPALEVDAGLFHAGQGQNDGTYKAWNVFRNIANYLFVIVFIITIFSQVTGVGGERFNFRKLIPKLLVVAILVNLSFIICQIAIDVGNIAGRGIGRLFNNIALSIKPVSSVPVDAAVVDSSFWSSYLSSSWNSALVIIVAVIGAGIALSQGLAVLIPALLGLISIFFSVITLVAILGIRQAAIVLLVAASPIAFICYALPNTKSIFKKWFDAFKALLLAFPICSALVY
ncbi:hypothetical protein IJM16_00520, partial [Candidatus Saccharibacteria bacterium]|nr:hypothetical protein [Candidatus Saccharibacteria bacterium]